MPASEPPGRTAAGSPAARKQEIRDRCARTRRARGEAARIRDDETRTGRLLELVDGRWPEPGAVIACYLSHAPEPDTLALVAALHSRGHRVLVPVLTGRGAGPRREIAWAWYRGPGFLTRGFRGIPDPLGEVLDASALRRADLVIVSALAAGRDGSRIGTGGGWYDRALAEAIPTTPSWALLNDDEVFDSLPQEPHDRRMDLLVTPTTILRTVPDASTAGLRRPIIREENA